ncbi:MAG: hypothetical protein KGL44_04735 [Sphingomonadales bacterium]|nr:hypothetical protein [Sphingomonadales bacterium]
MPPEPTKEPEPDRPRSLMAMVKQDGAMRVEALGLPRRLSTDLYHRLMQLTWPRLAALFAGVFTLFNLVFAALYRIDPTGLAVAHDASTVPLYWRDFFFSVHTVATVGYGNVYPVSLYANIIVALEIGLGLTLFALATGIAFARFSRPTARILFSDVLILRDVDGTPMLMLRAANQRHNMIFSAQVRMAMLIDSELGGVSMRRFVDLELERSSNPAFMLTWTIMHRIDEASPARPWLDGGAGAESVEFVVILSGFDESSGQTIHSSWAYGADDVRRDVRFADIVTTKPDGTRLIDYTRFHAVVDV